MDSKQYFILILTALFIIVLVLLMVLFLRFRQDSKKQFYKQLEDELKDQREQMHHLIFGLNNSMNDIKVNVNRDFINFNQHLKNDLNQFMEYTNERLNQIEDRMLVDLKENQERSNHTFLTINEKMIKIDEAQKGLHDLSRDIISLQSILQDKKTRGIYGEIELYHILESVFGKNEKRYKRQYKLSNNMIVDAVIFTNDLGIIPIDSKFPLENYRRIYDEHITKSEKEEAIKTFKKDVLKHINTIKTKYLECEETAEFAYMFIPAEAIFHEIHERFYDVIDYANQSKVYLVSPTTLMAYLTAIQSIYLNHKKDENAQELKTLLNELSIEFKRYNNRNEALYKEYKDLEQAFYNLFITGQKIEKRFQEINQLDFSERTDKYE